ncbi:hypothetical protein ACHHYP_17167 [Achlya hypogyna]|uniref:Uncharacterized protein n=1 Tax=Achlya hypogyna TaxID=1202772 RepID=A0A1V9Y4Z4_ACHHY|nr:hypothetical protein ACHHYP_17167 [Achlya hypogyna]
MKDVAAQVVGCVHEERFDADLAARSAAVVQAHPEAVPNYFQDVALMLSLGHSASSSSDSDSDSSSGSDAETIGTAMYLELECPLSEIQVALLLRYSLPILTAYRDGDERRATNLVPWASLALLWCDRSTTLEARNLVHSFLHLLCLLPADETGAVLAQLVAQVLDADDVACCPGYTVLASVVADVPAESFAALELVLPASLPRVAILLGHLCAAGLLPAVSLLVSPLWTTYLQAVATVDDAVALAPCLWFLALLVPSVAASVDAAAVIRPLRHAIEVVAPQTTPAPVHALTSLFSPSALPPPAPIAGDGAGGGDRFYEVPPPDRRWRIRGVDAWVDAASHTIVAIRLTVLDTGRLAPGHPRLTVAFVETEDMTIRPILGIHPPSLASDTAVVQHSAVLDAGEVLRRLDVAADGAAGVRGLRVVSDRREFPWLGEPAAVGPAPQASSDEEVVGLVGAFVDGRLRHLTGVTAGPTQQSLQYISTLFASLYAVQPWPCLELLRDDASPAAAAVRRGLCLQLRLHPGLVVAPPTTASDATVCAAWLQEPGLAAMFLEHESRRHLEALQKLQTRVASIGALEDKERFALRVAQTEKTLTADLLARLATHEAQMRTMEEQHGKWHKALQLRLASYARQLKAVTEQNLTLRHERQELEARLRAAEADVHLATAESLSLRGEVEHQQRLLAAHTGTADKCASLERQLADWREFHETTLDAEHRVWATERDHLVQTYEAKVFKARERAEAPAKPAGGGWDPAEDRSRLLELEKLVKQKARREQGLQALRMMLERQQTVSEETLKAVNRKYDNVKAINLAIQKRALGHGVLDSARTSI